MEHIIQAAAKEIIDEFDITRDNIEAWFDNTDHVDEASEVVEKYRGMLMNYDDYQQSYLDMTLDTVDAIVYGKETRENNNRAQPSIPT